MASTQENNNLEEVKKMASAGTPLIKVEPPPNVVAQRPVEAPPTVVSPPSVLSVPTPLPFTSAKASELSGALSVDSGPSKLIVKLVKDEKNPNIVRLETTLLGSWTGNWIKGALRSIEKSYNSIKHTAMRKAAEERMKQLVADKKE